ncbi:hypothetical protein [Intestinimonas butyriciproducens]|uniref:hypothetical protein n=2 Tax=Intestinimonas butyriciproducens TaxID=1297617 RepID=UPI002432E32C
MTMRDEIDRLIGIISARSNKYGDKLLKFMERYGLIGLAGAEPWQLREFIIEEFGEGALA